MPSDTIERVFSEEEQEALRQEVLRITQAENISQARIGTEAGLAPSTFGAWMVRTYAGRRDPIADKVKRWLDGRQARQETTAHLRKAPDFVRTAAANAFFATLRHAQFMPDMVTIIGGAGVGKTMAGSAYQVQAPNVFIVTAEPIHNSPRAILDAIAEEVGIDSRGLSSQLLSTRIVKKLRDSTGLLIIDEAQHLDSRSLDQVRTIHDLAKIGIALMGNDTILARLEGGSRSAHFAPLFRRVGKRTRRNTATKGDVDPLLDAWEVNDPECRRLLRGLATKPGALGLMTKTLQLGHMLAAGEGKPFGPDHVRMAATDLGTKGDYEDAA